MAITTDNTINLLEKSLDLRLRRSELLASNLANIDTPNYRPADLKFEGFLKEAQTPSGLAADTGEVVRDQSLATSLDGNTVNLDGEVAKVSDNTVRYTTAIELVRRKIAILSYAAGMGS